MPGFAPLAAAPLASAGAVAPRMATVTGSLDLRGNALAGLRASASANDLAPSLTGETAGFGAVEAAGSLGTAGIKGQAQGDTATRGLASGGALPLEGVVEAGATTTAAGAATLETGHRAQSGLVCAIRAEGIVLLGGAQSATSQIRGNAAPLWLVLSHIDAASAVSVKLQAGRLVPFVGAGHLQATGRAQAAGPIRLTGGGQLAGETRANVQTAVTAVGEAEAKTSLAPTLASNLALTGSASGITLQGRKARAGSVIAVHGHSTGSLPLGATLVSPYVLQGNTSAQAMAQARPDTAQGGSVISHLRSGQILRG